MGKNILGKIDTWLALWFIGYVYNTYAVSHTPCSHVFLYTCGWATLYILLRILPIERIGKQYWAYGCAILGVWQVAVGLGQLFGVCSSGHYLYAVTGNFFNPAPYGAFIAVMLAVVIAVYKEHPGRILGIAAIVMTVMLPAAWSRAALLGFAVSLGIMYRAWIRNHWRQVGIFAVVILVILYFLKRGSADSRMLMILVSLRTWADNLWVGTGTGSYLQALGEGMATYFTSHPASLFIPSVGIADRPFNEPLRMAVEQGMAGLISFTTAIVLTARRLWIAGSPLFYALVTLLVFSMFSYPFTIPAFCGMLSVIMAYAANLGKQYLFRPMMVFPFTAVGISCTFICVLLLPRMEAEKDYDRFSQIHDEAFIKDYYELFPLLNDNPQFLFDFGLLLRDCGRYNDSNAMLRQGTSLSADPMFHILMGRNYEDMEEYDKADSLYDHAFRMVPNRIYPLYRKMKLYEAMGDTTRCKAMACRVQNFRVKVESPATRDMKKEAKEIKQRKGNISK